jgi:hypothetical protein
MELFGDGFSFSHRVFIYSRYNQLLADYITLLVENILNEDNWYGFDQVRYDALLDRVEQLPGVKLFNIDGVGYIPNQSNQYFYSVLL